MDFTPKAVTTVDVDNNEVLVHVTWPNADVVRKDGTGYLVGGVNPRMIALASRLAEAIDAGAVYYDHEVRTDVNGHTFVSARSRVLGRMMNADLKRLGF